jgi:predicted GH43/DUF377 family glycosyl hydrolase
MKPLKAAPNETLHATLLAMILLSLTVIAHGDPTPFGLASPKDGDDFEVTKPLLFWYSSPDAKSYQVFVDDTKVGEVAAVPLPVVNYAIQTPLAVGVHHWYVKAVPASGDATTSGTFSFTIDSSGNWPSWAIGPFVRYGQNPILRPQGTGWESLDTYNPGVLFDQGKFRMLYRAQGDKRISREGYAESLDGVTFTRNPDPMINNTEAFEQTYGCEDARLFKYQGTYYAFYTGNVYNATTDPNNVSSMNKTVALCEATSTDGVTWKKLGIVVPGTKNAAMVCDPYGTPVKINNKFAMYIGYLGAGVAYSDDLIHWGTKKDIKKTDLEVPPDWQKQYEPCIAITDYSPSQPDNVVVFIAGKLNGHGKWFYSISEMLTSKADLTKKVAQLDDSIFKPREPYESGTFKNCLFMNCIIQHNQQWMMYYGAGDRNIGLATAPVNP